jgi:hypothetical protein
MCSSALPRLPRQLSHTEREAFAFFSLFEGYSAWEFVRTALRYNPPECEGTLAVSLYEEVTLKEIILLTEDLVPQYKLQEDIQVRKRNEVWTVL